MFEHATSAEADRFLFELGKGWYESEWLFWRNRVPVRLLKRHKRGCRGIFEHLPGQPVAEIKVAHLGPVPKGEGRKGTLKKHRSGSTFVCGICSQSQTESDLHPVRRAWDDFNGWCHSTCIVSRNLRYARRYYDALAEEGKC